MNDVTSTLTMLDEVANHLEFLGYRLEKTQVAGTLDLVSAKHDQKANVLMRPSAGGILVSAPFSTKVTDETWNEFLGFLNDVNQVLSVGKIYFIKTESGRSVIVEAWYQGPYSKVEFGRFMSLFEQSVISLSLRFPDQVKKFL